MSSGQQRPGQPRRKHAESVLSDSRAPSRVVAQRHAPELAEASANGRSRGTSGEDPWSARRVELTLASAISSERVRWLWRGRIPLRGLVVIAGEKGLGKSILTNAFLAAKLTRGELDGELIQRPVDVLVITGEDDWRSVVKPRLLAHGADLDRVHRVTVIDDAGESLLTLPDDVGMLEQQVERLRAAGRVVGMLVIDPIGAFISGAIDTHRDASVRRALAPLAAMADRLDLAVVVVGHLTKDESKRLIQRVKRRKRARQCGALRAGVRAGP
jgi:predicted ATP-dependent serine protease